MEFVQNISIVSNIFLIYAGIFQEYPGKGIVGANIEEFRDIALADARILCLTRPSCMSIEYYLSTNTGVLQSTAEGMEDYPDETLTAIIASCGKE